MPGLGEELPLIFGELDDANENNIRKLLRVWLSGVQGLEYALQQLYTERNIDNAIGAQLDVLGVIVGQPRNGLIDDTYRRHIRARISANRSKGTLKDLLTVADLVVFDDNAYYHVRRQRGGALHFKVEDVIVGPPAGDAGVHDALIDFLGVTAAHGVRVMLETWPEVETELFVLGGVGTTGDGKIGKGLGYTGNALLGGGLARAATS